MDKILKYLDELVDLFESTHCYGNKAKRKVMFQPLANKINGLHLLLAGAGIAQTENIRRILTHYGAILGVEPTNGHSVEQHLAWANMAITVIKRDLKRGQNS